MGEAAEGAEEGEAERLVEGAVMVPRATGGGGWVCKVMGAAAAAAATEEEEAAAALAVREEARLVRAVAKVVVRTEASAVGSKVAVAAAAEAAVARAARAVDLWAAAAGVAGLEARCSHVTTIEIRSEVAGSTEWAARAAASAAGVTEVRGAVR